MTSQSLPPIERLRWISFQSDETPQDHGQEVIRGLQNSPKTLPCRYFYDDYGSSLFEKITELPEYYLTRTEQSILEHYALAIAQMTGPCDLIELGSGSSSKTRLLLTAYDQVDPTLRYCPIDVSAGILKESALMLLQQYERLSVVGLAGTYEQALSQLPVRDEKPRLILFLGSTLGNMSGQANGNAPSEQTQFFNKVQTALNPGDYFLLGVDLQKPVDLIEAAYNDSQGITAAFNLNMLTHLNRQFMGNFHVDQFAHQATYNSQLNQIEMRLQTQQAQSIKLDVLDFSTHLSPNEAIVTEISRKFDRQKLSQSLTQSGLNPVHIWTDPQEWFALLLCQK